MIALLLSVFCFSIFVQYLWRRRVAKTGFPGPPTDPFIGHLRIFPYVFPEVKLWEWAKQYGMLGVQVITSQILMSLEGHIIQLSAPGKTILVLSEAEDAHCLLDKRGSNYSDRPSSILHGELWVTSFFFFLLLVAYDIFYIINRGGLEDFLALIQYGDNFRAHRRLITQYFNSRSHINLLPLISDQVKVLLENLRDEPERFEDHLDRYIRRHFS